MAEATTSSDGNKAVADIEKTPVIVSWKETIELGYEVGGSNTQTILPSNNNTKPKKISPICFRCGKADTKLSKCARCNTASYCSKECQVSDWKALSKGGGGHKSTCFAYARLSLDDDINGVQVTSPEHKETIRNEIFGRIRIYACAYAVHHTRTLGTGFLFLQSDSTLATLSTPFPKDGYGYTIPQMRAVLMHFLTLAEYDSEVCRDDFEMMQVRTQLQEAVKDYDEHKEVVVLMRFRCGHVALGRATLVPDHGVCKTLGNQYFADNKANAVQLNLDDM